MTNFIKTAFANRYSNPLELFPVILLAASGLTVLVAIGLWGYQTFYQKQPLQMTLSSVIQHKHNPCLKILSREGMEKSYRYCQAYAESGDVDAELIVGIQTYLGLGTQPNAEKAMVWFSRAAKQAHPQAQYLLSLAHEHGVGVSKSLDKALDWATEAAEYPYVVYTHQLGHLQRNRYPQKAHENLMKAANINFAPSQYELGLMYLKGEIKQDANQGFYWINQAAQHKFVPAYLELAKLYQQGQGTVVDGEQAFQYLSKAAGENVPEAQFRLGLYLLNEQTNDHEPQQALNWLIQAAKNNYTPAKAKIGEIYFEGHYVEKDIQQALAWWVSAAKDKDYAASYHLGQILEAGQFVPKDLSAAVYWYLQSAEGNYAKAQLKLAEFYYQGIGVTQDPLKSFILYSQAASQGEMAASLPLAYLYDKGIGTTQDKQKASYWYQRAAQQENPDAWYALGLSYLNSGDATQAPLAKMWLGKAAGMGHASAQYQLAMMVSQGIGGTEANQQEAKELMTQASSNGLPEAKLWVATENAASIEASATESIPEAFLKRSAEVGDPKALFQLGRAMLNGNAILNITANPQEGISYIEKSAKEGLDIAALYLGRIYVTGEEPNVPASYGKALNWLDKPARQGNSEAQYYLGQMFYQGLGVSKNNVRAYAWLNLSAAQGNDHAGLIRNQLALELSPPDLEKAQKLSLEYMGRA